MLSDCLQLTDFKLIALSDAHSYERSANNDIASIDKNSDRFSRCDRANGVAQASQD